MMSRKHASWRVLVVLIALATGASEGQDTQQQRPESKSKEIRRGNPILRVAGDQKAIWTAPVQVRRKDLLWLVPAAVVMGETFHRDRYIVDRVQSPRLGKRFDRVSDAGLITFGTLAAGSYVIGRVNHNEHMKETGVLSFQALTNSFLVANALKYTLGRRAPAEAKGGGFFHPGAASFPSDHAVYSWTVASVIAHEYPGWFTKTAVYGLASAVSLSRVGARKHHATDVIAGSAIGWGIGRLVYKRHHDPLLPGDNIGDFVDPTLKYYAGSTYEPLDSWTYLAIERLAALGYVRSAFTGLKPWTRVEMARMVSEADANIELSAEEVPEDRQYLVNELKRHLRLELDQLGKAPANAFVLESVYARVRGLTGPPLTDGFHLGQTFYNDFGRPYGEGVDAVVGASFHATRGRWAFYGRAEFQHAPSLPTPPSAAQAAAAAADQLPFSPLRPRTQVDRVRLLDAYVSVNLHDWRVSLGQQSLNWGPARSGSMSYSENADPVMMLRVSRDSPMYLPWVFKYLGPSRAEVFFGRLEGHRWVRTATGFFGPIIRPAPFIHGQKFSFAPTPNLQIGVSVTTLLGGPGFPLTPRTILRSFGFSNTNPGQPNDPGDRRAGLTMSYRLPRIRSVNFYLDQMTEDEISPIGYPRRSATNTGLFFSRLPRLPRTDLRLEGFFTDVPGLRQVGSYFANSRYLSGYTNNENLLGHPVGRDGTGVLAEARYWRTAKNSIGIFYRNSKVNPEHVRLGGRLDDGGVFGDFSTRGGLNVTARLQYERWHFPVLSPTAQSNISVAFEVRLPSRRLK